MAKIVPLSVRRLRAQLHRFSREHVFMLDEPLFYSMDGTTLGKDLLKVLCRIAREKGRVEITNCEGHSCVMISKEELELIESALEILSNLHEVQLLHDKVKHVLTLDDETQPVPNVRMEALEQAR
jgi:PHD/YefM family antitoxin component YafN of YafNO toxin-antitoxin module